MTDAVSPPQSPLQLSEHLAAIVAATAPSVVAVRGHGRRPSSGLIWEPGLAVTAEETIERDDALALTLPDGRRVEATLAGRDPTTDIAVLRYAGNEAGLASQPAAKDLRPGHLALAVGRYYGGDVVAALGIVARVGPAWHSSQGGLIDARLSIDARLAATTEGGALVAADGGLIGMAAFGPRRRVLAIPTATIGRVVAVIKEKGHVARGYLGVGLQRVPLHAHEATHGGEQRRAAMVVTLDPAGPAKAAGILQGDIIVAVGGTAVTGVRSLYQQLGPDSVGRKMAIDLVRAGMPMKVDVIIAPRARA